MKLAMTILARDEADIIEDNIRFHADAGVDKFVVTDNSSQDGTREILSELSKEFDIEIFDEVSLTIDQDLWVSRMANWLKENDNCDWIINNDADEIWVSSTGCLKGAISDSLNMHKASGESDVGVLTCGRQNMIASKETTDQKGYAFYHSTYAVVKNVNADSKDAEWDKESGNIVLRKVPGKVITRANGLESIGMGNHGAVHEGSKAPCRTIRIFHYPIRSYSQFQKKVVNYGSSLERNPRFGPNTSMYLRFWYECYKAGTLEEQYELYVLSEKALADLLKNDVIKKDNRVLNCFSHTLGVAA